MPQTSFPALGLSLTDTFARYTGAARFGMNGPANVINVMEGLIRDEASGVQLVVRNGSRVGSTPLAEIVREVIHSPVFEAGMKDEARPVKISEPMADTLKRIGEYVAAKNLAEKPLDAGRAYLLSVMVLNHIHDRQPTPRRDSTVATYDAETWSPRSCQSGVMFALS
jgi:hypothetical protein